MKITLKINISFKLKNIKFLFIHIIFIYLLIYFCFFFLFSFFLHFSWYNPPKIITKVKTNPKIIKNDPTFPILDNLKPMNPISSSCKVISVSNDCVESFISLRMFNSLSEKFIPSFKIFLSNLISLCKLLSKEIGFKIFSAFFFIS